MPNPLTAVIVDDERLARKGLRLLLKEHAHITVVGEADGVDAAAACLEASQPDVLFLDIQMPGETGFNLLDRVSGPWHIIFVTAYDAYAIRAFEVNALDYLLKPVHPERLMRALERLDGKHAPDHPPLRSLEYADHLFVTLDNQARFLKINTIECIRAAGDYSEVLLTGGQTGLVLQTLKEWESRLPDRHFARIHRSTIVNFDAIDRIEPWFHQSYRVFLRSSDEPAIMSRRYASRLKHRMQ